MDDSRTMMRRHMQLIKEAEDFDVIAYHGSDQDFESFDEQTIRANRWGPYGFCFVQDPQAAASYGDIVYKVELRIKHPRIVQNAEDFHSFKNHEQQLQMSGVDAVAGPNDLGQFEIVVFDPANVRILKKIGAQKAQVSETIQMPKTRHEWYWHGTNNVAGQKIMREGFRVDALRPRSKHYLPPVHQGTYLTPRFLSALWMAGSQNKQLYGWVFGIRAEKLTDIEIDEDEIGLAVRAAYHKLESPNADSSQYARKFAPMDHLSYTDDGFRTALLQLANAHLPADLITNLRHYNRWNARWFSGAGRILNPLLALDMKLKLIAAGCHIAHLQPIAPDQAWRFDSKKGTDIHNSFLRVGFRALEQFATRMK